MVCAAHTIGVMAYRSTIKAADLQRIGISKPYAHQLASGRSSPSLKMAIKIKSELGVPVDAWPLARRAANDTQSQSEAA